MQAHADGIASTNSYVEIIPNATNLKARKQDKNNSQRSSSGFDFIITPERTNICQQGQTVSQCTTTYNFSGLGYVPTGSATSIHFGNTPANSYLVFINDDHNNGTDRTSKIGQIVFDNEILVHVSEDKNKETRNYLSNNNIIYTFTDKNVGLCTAINTIAKKTNNKYIIYSHDDMYFCPNWEEPLFNEIENINHNYFYISGSMIEPYSGHIKFDCGENLEQFEEKKLLDNLNNLNIKNHQGSHFAPHLVTKNIWNLVGGFSEEFNPAIGSDPDFNMKLWTKGVRIFKGINNFKVYHFGGQTTRKKKDILFKKNQGSRANKIFLLKWGFSIKFFKKYYLKSNTRYVSQLNGPNKNIYYYKDLLINKLYYYVIKITKK